MRRTRQATAPAAAPLFPRGTRVEIAIGWRQGQRGTVRHQQVVTVARPDAVVCRVQIDGNPDTHTYAGWELRALSPGEMTAELAAEGGSH